MSLYRLIESIATYPSMSFNVVNLSLLCIIVENLNVGNTSIIFIAARQTVSIFPSNEMLYALFSSMSKLAIMSM